MKKEYPLHYEMRKWYKYNKEIYRMWRRFLTLGDVTGGSVASSTMNPVNSMFTDEIRSLFNGKLPQFDARELLKPKTVAFIYVSPVNTAQHRFCSIMYQQLFKRLFELGEGGTDGALPYPVQVLCDDFATGCKVQDFHELISIFREKGISATMLVQSETQLSSMYGKENATTIVNNCDTYIYLGAMDLPTCENISLRLDRELSEVLSMPVGTEYFFRRGKKPIVTKRYNLFLDPQYIRYFGDETNSKSR